jgi:hypothetical protein
MQQSRRGPRDDACVGGEISLLFIYDNWYYSQEPSLLNFFVKFFNVIGWLKAWIPWTSHGMTAV